MRRSNISSSSQCCVTVMRTYLVQHAMSETCIYVTLPETVEFVMPAAAALMQQEQHIAAFPLQMSIPARLCCCHGAAEIFRIVMGRNHSSMLHMAC